MFYIYVWQKYNDEDQKNAFVNFESTLCEKLINRGYTDVCSNGEFVDTQTCWICQTTFGTIMMMQLMLFLISYKDNVIL